LAGDWAIIHPRLADELKPIETETAILVNSINRQASGELARRAAEMTSIQRNILWIVPATAICTILITAFLVRSMARRITELRRERHASERTPVARELHDTLL
jgi:signal transduction histidine kinase